ncbi:hypothetical protein TNCV_3877941 [Trichonephila clavipes]|uniref:Uncharacterized protein n=1 Tax=Trichonephila clavipes TaxID=2585209 RepID=A0A8X6STB3_TRICX|nr:hypothetical protein TNCV_3877941 [Trichonephila clavipes]
MVNELARKLNDEMYSPHSGISQVQMPLYKTHIIHLPSLLEPHVSVLVDLEWHIFLLCVWSGVTTGDDKDIELGPLLRALREGKDLQGREAQYTIEDGCIMYGQRVCIPRKFRSGRITCWTLSCKNEGT